MMRAVVSFFNYFFVRWVWGVVGFGFCYLVCLGMLLTARCGRLLGISKDTFLRRLAGWRRQEGCGHDHDSSSMTDSSFEAGEL